MGNHHFLRVLGWSQKKKKIFGTENQWKSVTLFSTFSFHLKHHEFKGNLFGGKSPTLLPHVYVPGSSLVRCKPESWVQITQDLFLLRSSLDFSPKQGLKTPGFEHKHFFDIHFVFCFLIFFSLCLLFFDIHLVFFDIHFVLARNQRCWKSIILIFLVHTWLIYSLIVFGFKFYIS